jgi:cell division septal protein FtsQ
MDKRLRERRRQVNQERGRRRAGLIFLVALVIVAAVAFLWLRSSSVFALETVTASATLHVTKEQIAEAAAQSRGESLLRISTGHIERALSALPYTRTVHVYRRFPNGLDIQIEEYEPAAGVQAGNGKAWLVADDGRVLEKATQQALSSLPLLVGTDGLEVQPGGSIPQALLAAMPVVQMLNTPDVSASLPALEYISVSTGGDVVVHLQGGTELRLGEPVDLKQKMMDAADIIQKYLRDGKTLEYVDASAGGRLAVKAK